MDAGRNQDGGWGHHTLFDEVSHECFIYVKKNS